MIAINPALVQTAEVQHHTTRGYIVRVSMVGASDLLIDLDTSKTLGQAHKDGLKLIKSLFPTFSIY